MCELGPFPLPWLALALALDPDIPDSNILDPTFHKVITKFPLHLASDTSVLFPLPS